MITPHTCPPLLLCSPLPHYSVKSFHYLLFLFVCLLPPAPQLFNQSDEALKAGTIKGIQANQKVFTLGLGHLEKEN